MANVPVDSLPAPTPEEWDLVSAFIAALNGHDKGRWANLDARTKQQVLYISELLRKIKQFVDNGFANLEEFEKDFLHANRDMETLDFFVDSHHAL